MCANILLYKEVLINDTFLNTNFCKWCLQQTSTNSSVLINHRHYRAGRIQNGGDLGPIHRVADSEAILQMASQFCAKLTLR